MHVVITLRPNEKPMLEEARRRWGAATVLTGNEPPNAPPPPPAPAAPALAMPLREAA